MIRENTSFATSLYFEQTAFMVSSVKEKVVGLSVTFNFNSQFTFDNTNSPMVQHFEIKNSQNKIILNISRLASGMYFLKIDNKVIKIVKE